jgi:hypothetical protein
MADLDPRDAAILAQLEGDPFASGVRLLTLDEAAGLIASEPPRSRAEATFTRGHRGPALVLIGTGESHG